MNGKESSKKIHEGRRLCLCFYCKRVIFPWSKGWADASMTFNGFTTKPHRICSKCVGEIIERAG